MTPKPQRRGLGRGLGSLIPTGPRHEREPDSESADLADETAAGQPAGERPEWVGPPTRQDRGGAVQRGDTPGDDTPGGSLPTDGVPGGDNPDGNPPGGDAAGARTPGGDSVGLVVPGGADWIGVPLPGDSGEGTLALPAGIDTVDRAADPGTASATEPDGDPADDRVDGPELGPVHGAWFAELPVGDISPNPRQPRETFDEETMAELVASIHEVGLLQPVVVRPVEGGRYELVMGERRWRATKQAGQAVIPAIVRETADEDLLRDALLENLHRSQLNALEEAAAYQQLLEDFGCTHDELASRIGRSRPQISNTIRLLKLSPAVQRRVAAGVLSAGHARALLAIEDAAVQDRLAGRVVAEGISVRGLEEIVAVGERGSDANRPVRRSRPTAPGVDDLAARLSDRLETRVRVALGRRTGRITIEFASLPDLERIVAVIDPGHPTRTHQDGSSRWTPAHVDKAT